MNIFPLDLPTLYPSLWELLVLLVVGEADNFLISSSPEGVRRAGGLLEGDWVVPADRSSKSPPALTGTHVHLLDLLWLAGRWLRFQERYWGCLSVVLTSLQSCLCVDIIKKIDGAEKQDQGDNNPASHNHHNNLSILIASPVSCEHWRQVTKWFTALYLTPYSSHWPALVGEQATFARAIVEF